MYVYALVLLVALSRLLPHPPNFTCLGALALFAGCTMQSHRGMLVPLVALLISDLLGHFLRIPGMGFYGPVGMLFVYGGFACVAGLGYALRGPLGRGGIWGAPVRIGVASLAGSTLFFLLSNFGVFLSGAYGLSLSGLTRCYVAALPFFGNTVSGDLFYGTLLFGSAALLGAPALRPATAPAVDTDR